MNMPGATPESDPQQAVLALLEDDAVRAVFQPIVRLLDGAVVGYEALARMKHLPYRPPDQWLALAEEAGVGDALELLCLRAAAASGAPPNDSLLFVNVSPKWLADPANLAARDWLPDRLVLELSERDAVEEYEALRDAMLRWKAVGARIAVDDMGSGWSSMRHVIQLRPDFIKIDRSLIDHIDTDRSKRALTCALVAFGREAGCAVIAEGVERREELDTLLEADVAYAQGYLLARPAPAWPSCATLSSWSTDEAVERREPRRVGLTQRLQRAADCRDACEVVSEHLWRLGSLMPSVYLERGGVLRCIAQRGLWQVLDGMPVGVGITGRVYELGSAIRLDDVRLSADYLEAIPGVVAEMCVPVFVDGRIAGALNVESYAPLTDDAADEVTRCASLLGHRLAIVGAAEEESSSQRLARHVMRLAEVTDEHLLEAALLEAAIDLSGLASAALIRLDDRGLPYLARVTGSDAEAFGLASSSDLHALDAIVEPVASCYTAGDTIGAGIIGADHLRAGGIHRMVIVPLATSRGRIGLLWVADSLASSIDTTEVERLELLGRHAAHCIENIRRIATLRDRAKRDSLTGLQNRSAFCDQLLRDLRLVPREQSRVLLLADIDDFKSVNDRFGHVVGDDALTAVAHALRNAFRQDDAVFRIGGDEFAMIVDDVEHRNGLSLDERITIAAGAALKDFGASLSVGMASLLPADTIRTAMARADAALYRSKSRRLAALDAAG
jgi:diguanylate cyclase (GGDEF)-like protein